MKFHHQIVVMIVITIFVIANKRPDTFLYIEHMTQKTRILFHIKYVLRPKLKAKLIISAQFL